MVGETIVAINNTPVTSRDAAIEALKSLRDPGSTTTTINLTVESAAFEEWTAVMERPSTERTWGIELESSSYRVKNVLPRRATDRAGIKKGDVITHFNGRRPRTPAELVSWLRKVPDDVGTVELKVRTYAPANELRILVSPLEGLMLGDSTSPTKAAAVDVPSATAIPAL